MNIISTIDIDVCVDCAMYLANATVGDDHPDNRPDDDADENATTRHAAKIEARWPRAGGWHVHVNNPAGFSMSGCDGCGSNLGGDRYNATAVRDDSAALAALAGLEQLYAEMRARAYDEGDGVWITDMSGADIADRVFSILGSIGLVVP